MANRIRQLTQEKYINDVDPRVPQILSLYADVEQSNLKPVIVTKAMAQAAERSQNTRQQLLQRVSNNQALRTNLQNKLTITNNSV
jgi:hypothetical protein